MTTEAFFISAADGWQAVAVGKHLVQVQGPHQARLHTGSAPPALDTEAYHPVSETVQFSYSGADTIYIRADPYIGVGTLKVVVSD